MAKFNVDLLAFDTNTQVVIYVPNIYLTEDIDANLSLIFAYGNLIGLKHRSVYAGDIIHYNDSQYKILPVGFELVLN